MPIITIKPIMNEIRIHLYEFTIFQRFYFKFLETNLYLYEKQEWQHSQKRSSTNRLAANITEYHIISKIILQRIIITKFMMLRQLFHVKIYKKKWKKSILLKSVLKQDNWALVVQTDVWSKLRYWIWIPNEFPVYRKDFG